MNEEYILMKKEIDSILKKYLIEDKLPIEYGNTTGIPDEIAVLRKKLGWYLYSSDERNNAWYEGPYDFNAFIQIISMRFPLNSEFTKEIRQKYKSIHMDNFEYIDNILFKSELEIDSYEVEHPEKKFE